MAPRAFLMFFCVPPPDIIAPSLLSTKKEKKKRKKKITKEQSLRSQQTNTNWKLKLELLHAQQENQEQYKPTRSSQDNGKKNYDTKKATRISKAKPGSSKLGRENTTENKHHQQPTQKPIKTQFFLPSNHIEGAHKPKSYQKKKPYKKPTFLYKKRGRIWWTARKAEISVPKPALPNKEKKDEDDLVLGKGGGGGGEGSRNGEVGCSCLWRRLLHLLPIIFIIISFI